MKSTYVHMLALIGIYDQITMAIKSRF